MRARHLAAWIGLLFAVDAAAESRPVVYDVATGERTVLPAADLRDAPPAATGGFAAVDALYRTGDGDAPASLRRNMNGWTLVPDAQILDYPKRVKIFVQSEDFSGDTWFGECSGTMISPQHVLTAAHCVYTHTNSAGVPVDDFVPVLVAPGYQLGFGSWGSALAVSYLAFTGWIDERDRADDMALITLDRPVGGLVGWHQFGYNTDCGYWTDPTWIIRGYPAEAPYDGQTQWETSGSFDGCGGGLATFASPSAGGASGSGATRGGVVRGTLASSDRVSNTTFTRMTPGKFDAIQAQVFADQPDLPDVQPMAVRTSASEGSIGTGETLTDITFAVHNFAALAFGGVIDYRLILSNDPTIGDADDRLLFEGAVNALVNPNGTVVFGVPDVQIPVDLTPGAYRVGLAFDVTDANPANDVTRDPADQDGFVVTCGTPAGAIATGPADGATCLPLDGVVLQWQAQADAASYELEWAEQFGTTQTVTGMPGTGYVLGTLDTNTTYVWRVRARNACGNAGPWSASRTFRTVDTPAVPLATSPADGDVCQPATGAFVDWDDVPGAVAYQIRTSSQCGVPVPPVTVTTSERTYGTLAENTTWYYEIRAQGSCGTWSAWSECRSFRTLPTSLPAPTNFSPASGASCVGAPASVAWNRVDEADGYQIEYGPDTQQTQLLVSAINVAQLPIDAGGPWVWRVRALRCGNISRWSAWQDFVADTQAPPPVEGLRAISHDGDAWNATAEVTLEWTDAADVGSCGIVLHDVVWGTGSTPPPRPWFDTAGVAPYTTGPLDDGPDQWIHFWTKDAAGNVASRPTSVGPFRIDTTGPEAPVVTAVPAPGAWSNAAGLSLSWPDPVDTWNSVDGFAFGLVPDSLTAVDPRDRVDRNATAYDTVPEGTAWFRIVAIDALGNAGPQTAVGPFRFDRTAPVLAISAPVAGDELTHDEVFRVRWTASDALAGTDEVALDYTADGVEWRPIVRGDAALLDGRHDWVVPFATSGQVRLRLTGSDRAGNVGVVTTPWFEVSTRVAAPAAGTPRALTLDEPRPNPFNPRTTLRFAVPRAGAVRLLLHDTTGRVVRTLFDGAVSTVGWHTVTWDGQDDAGRRVSSGVYFARVEAAGAVRTKRLTLVK